MLMNWIFVILVGALIGWLASVVMKTDAKQGAVANILIGIIGSALGGWLFGDVLHIGGAAAAGTFSIIGIVWGVVGAIVLIFGLRSIKAI